MKEFVNVGPFELVKVLRKVYPLPAEIYEDLVDNFNGVDTRAEAEIITMIMMFCASNDIDWDCEAYHRFSLIPDDILDKFFANTFLRLFDRGIL